MFLTILIAFFSIISLMIIHELGHFIIAKKFKVKVEEFGIFLPPRLFGKKIGETIYSLNLIPFGAFVKVHGEEGGVENAHSFSEKPIWQRALIVSGGVISFWLVAIILLSMVAGIWGMNILAENDNEELINPRVQIIGVASESPAQLADLKFGDTIIGFEKITEFQDYIEQNKGEKIILTIEREGKVFQTESIEPRVSPPEGEGSLGVGLARTGLKNYSWYQAPIEGLRATGRLVQGIFGGWLMGIKHLLGIEKIPDEMEMKLVGPVGIVNILVQQFERGINDFLYFIALITIALAIINAMPIPALDGGKLLFLGIEKIKGSPINPRIEKKITTSFFLLLIGLMVFITIKDIISFF